jgi:L-fuconolactonase
MQNIIDSHIHFWNPDRLQYSWLKSVPTINRSFAPVDLPASGNGWTMDGLIFVEADVDADYGLREAQWVASLANEDSRIKGIVAFAPLDRGVDARAHLDQLQQIPLVKSVRRLIQSEPLGFCIQPQFVEGVKLLHAYDLRFDICVYHPQLPDVIELVRQCPEIEFVLDHIGKPGIKDQSFSPWRENIKTLAQFPNVYCKISGLVTEADHENWRPEQLQPYIDHVLEVFGVDRVMYGGDWPVSLLASSYDRWIETIMVATQSLAVHERQKLFHDNAMAFYRV